MDLRHLALILDAGSKAAADLDDPALSHALAHMTELAVAFAQSPDGGDLFPVGDWFAELADRYQ